MAKVEIDVLYAKVIADQLDAFGRLVLQDGLAKGDAIGAMMRASSVAAGMTLMRDAIKAAEESPDGIGVFGAGETPPDPSQPCELCGEIHGSEPDVIDVEGEDSPQAA